ncbi:response regulator transcription factor [Gilvimarinus polysaccharolyticus]|uniref:response regulator transcription factor n=1 Tax=Gilvimarinus polysaccharolyticus TaxID=863921 RepID=UPI000A00A5F4|nr:response regulator transcription factor [Gilvimarinus polysaccharolyticus]
MADSIHLAYVNTKSPQNREKKRFLVVEDEQDLAELVRMHLSELDADVTVSYRGDEALQLALSQVWHAIVLDLSLPGIDGLDICRELRSQGVVTPVLILTSRSTELDRVLGLELGADDYLTKPFSTLELKARIKALLRRAEHNAVIDDSPAQTVSVGGLHIDQAQRSVSVNGESVELTAREFELIWYFVSHPGRVFRRSELLDAVWGYGHDGYEHTVNSHINRLRGKIEDNPAEPKYLKTVWGVGYKFCGEPCIEVTS